MYIDKYQNILKNIYIYIKHCNPLNLIYFWFWKDVGGGYQPMRQKVVSLANNCFALHKQ